MADTKTNIKSKANTKDESIDWHSWMKKAKIDYAIYKNEKTYTSPQEAKSININLNKLKKRMTHVKYFSIIYELTFMLTTIL